MQFASAASFALAFLLLSPAHATDTLAPGFHVDRTHAFGLYDNYATLSNGYVMTPPSQNEVRITTDSHGNTIQTDKTTINKITPMSSDRMTSDRTTTVTGSE